MPFKRGHLFYFVTVADEGQLTRAAAKLDIAQPALSQAMLQLECELGFQLLERHPRGVTLTPAGEAFLEKARRAVASDTDAAETARWLGRAARGTIEFGFVGTPPGLDSPRQLAAFSEQHPDIDIRYRELPFPSLSTSAWLAEVDVAVCHAPPADPQIWTRALRFEPRVVLAAERHPICASGELAVDEVLDETFVGFHPSISPAWAGFWSLDDHRGGPPGRLTADRAANPHEVLASLAVRSAITTVPASVARVIMSLPAGVVAIPLRDAAPASIVLVGHQSRQNPLVDAFLDFADRFTAARRGAAR